MNQFTILRTVRRHFATFAAYFERIDWKQDMAKQYVVNPIPGQEPETGRPTHLVATPAINEEPGCNSGDSVVSVSEDASPEENPGKKDKRPALRVSFFNKTEIYNRSYITWLPQAAGKELPASEKVEVSKSHGKLKQVRLGAVLVNIVA